MLGDVFQTLVDALVLFGRASGEQNAKHDEFRAQTPERGPRRTPFAPSTGAQARFFEFEEDVRPPVSVFVEDAIDDVDVERRVGVRRRRAFDVFDVSVSRGFVRI